jgi:hypothetical protein
MRGWVLDGDWEGGRYNNPCESAYVVAASVRASNCSGVSCGGQAAKLKEVINERGYVPTTDELLADKISVPRVHLEVA